MNISEETFYETYKPQVNHIDGNASYNGCMYETFGKELDYVLSMIDSKRVWTIVEGDNNSLYISAGYHLVNRQGFMVTEKPFETGNEEVCLEEEVDSKSIRKNWNTFLADKNMKIGKVRVDEGTEKFSVAIVDKTTGKQVHKFESEFDLSDAVNEMEWFFATDEAIDEKGNKIEYACPLRSKLEENKLVYFCDKDGVRKFKSKNLDKIKAIISQ